MLLSSGPSFYSAYQFDLTEIIRDNIYSTISALFSPAKLTHNSHSGLEIEASVEGEASVFLKAK